MTKPKSKTTQTYSGRSIAEQILEGTWLGNLLYGEPEKYTDGHGKPRSHASFAESANGQMVNKMKDTGKDTGHLIVSTLADVPVDIYDGVKSAVNGDWNGVTLAAASLALPQIAESALKWVKTADGKIMLKELGLTEYDFKRLIERGWTPEQIFEASGRHGLDMNVAKPNSNSKATLISNEMKDLGMSPGMQSRLEYLTEQSKKGIRLIKDKYGNPYTIIEWSKLPSSQRGLGKSDIDLQYVDDWYNTLIR